MLKQLKIPCSRLQGIFDCKEFCQFFDSLANPQQAAGNALAVAVQSYLQGMANNDPDNSRGYLMKLSIPLKDIMLAPGKRFDPSSFSEKDVIERVNKIYGVITEVMDIAIQEAKNLYRELSTALGVQKQGH